MRIRISELKQVILEVITQREESPISLVDRILKHFKRTSDIPDDIVETMVDIRRGGFVDTVTMRRFRTWVSKNIP